MAGQRVCLDTAFIIDLLRGVPAAVDKAKELKEAGPDLYTTSINAFELYIGAIRSEDARRIVKLEGLLADLKLLAPGKEEAEESAKILVELMKKGKSIEMRDALIAGSILKNGCYTIVTRDVRDFSRIKKLQVVSY